MERGDDDDRELKENKKRVMEKINNWGASWYFDVKAMEK